MAVGTLFDGTNDYILSNTGTDMSMTAFTVGAMVYIDSYSGPRGIITTDNGSTAAPRIILGVGDTPDVFIYVFPAAAAGFLNDALGAEDAWYLIFMTKAAGTTTPRCHVYNGTSWTHNNIGSGTTSQPDPTSTVARVLLGEVDTTPTYPFFGEIVTAGIWAEDTNDATCETYVNYTTLAAKSNKRFFTDRSLRAGGTMADSGVGNSETSRVGATTGVQQIPPWFINFSMTPADYPPRRPQNLWVARGRGRTTRSR